MPYARYSYGCVVLLVLVPLALALAFVFARGVSSKQNPRAESTTAARARAEAFGDAELDASVTADPEVWLLTGLFFLVIMGIMLVAFVGAMAFLQWVRG
jgi:hypothetical protein